MVKTSVMDTCMKRKNNRFDKELKSKGTDKGS